MVYSVASIQKIYDSHMVGISDILMMPSKVEVTGSNIHMYKVASVAVVVIVDSLFTVASGEVCD